ncbi:hypothetical protein P154DRAFT_130971 [Amniculicola lignicola CBS 123094]|uniref:Uncharacterized protein n=1 Tax=Amniculicola lignicola CBS 123094 TaxID=1392246 RepID=A0A6A5WR14_9PLEO|nr:hypothetical protein P154DRAFT_130971 [Amniculicola lignicola CBS 123094]
MITCGTKWWQGTAQVLVTTRDDSGGDGELFNYGRILSILVKVLRLPVLSARDMVSVYASLLVEPRAMSGPQRHSYHLYQEPMTSSTSQPPSYIPPFQPPALCHHPATTPFQQLFPKTCHPTSTTPVSSLQAHLQTIVKPPPPPRSGTEGRRRPDDGAHKISNTSITPPILCYTYASETSSHVYP